MKGETIEVDLYITQYLPKPLNEESLLAINTGEKRKERIETCFEGCELLLVKMILMLIGRVMRGNCGGVNDNAKGHAGTGAQ